MIVIKLWRFLMNTFDLDSFFPKDKLQLIKVEQTKETIHIYLKSITKSCVCPKCGQSTEEISRHLCKTRSGSSYFGKKCSVTY